MAKLLEPPPCQHCNGACCTQTMGQRYAVEVSDSEAPDFPEAQTFVEGGYKFKAIPYADGRCIYLTTDNRCQVYEKRPQLCRGFHCGEGYNLRGSGQHGYFLESAPHVVQLLEQYCRSVATKGPQR